MDVRRGHPDRPSAVHRPPSWALGATPDISRADPHLRDTVALAEAEDVGTETAEGAPAHTPPAKGTQPVLVILAQFNDRALTTTPTDWSTMWFGTDQSVADYYDEASFGLLDLEPATESDTALGGRADHGVVAVVYVPTAHPNSGSTFAVFQDTVSDILSDSQLDAAVDFAAYDTDNDNHGLLSSTWPSSWRAPRRPRAATPRRSGPTATPSQTRSPWTPTSCW